MRAAASAILLIGLACDLPFSGGEGGFERLWRSSIESNDNEALVVPAEDGERFFVPIAGEIRAYDKRDGTVAWATKRYPYGPFNVVVRDDALYYAGSLAVALDAESGEERWQQEIEGSASFCEISADEAGVYVGTTAHLVYALDPETGAVRWQTDVGPEWKYKGTVRGTAVRGDTVYAGVQQYHSDNGHISSGWIIALDRETGAEYWRYRNGAGEDWRTISSAPTVTDGLLLASDLRDNTFFAVDRFTGEEAWRVEGDEGYLGPALSPVVHDGTAYVASPDMHVYAVDAQTGAERWRTQVMGGGLAAEVCGRSVFAQYQGVAVLERETGAVRDTLFHSLEDHATSAFAVSGDQIFFVGDRYVYSYRCP